jgi:hypothetical protein
MKDVSASAVIPTLTLPQGTHNALSRRKSRVESRRSRCKCPGSRAFLFGPLALVPWDGERFGESGDCGDAEGVKARKPRPVDGLRAGFRGQRRRASIFAIQSRKHEGSASCGSPAVKKPPSEADPSRRFQEACLGLPKPSGFHKSGELSERISHQTDAESREPCTRTAQTADTSVARVSAPPSRGCARGRAPAAACPVAGCVDGSGGACAPGRAGGGLRLGAEPPDDARTSQRRLGEVQWSPNLNPGMEAFGRCRGPPAGSFNGAPVSTGDGRRSISRRS